MFRLGAEAYCQCVYNELFDSTVHQGRDGVGDMGVVTNGD